MNRERNPYTPGAGLPPPELAGRDHATEDFRTVLARVAQNRPDRSTVLFGLRGVGKTVLLAHFQSVADSMGWTTGWADMRSEQSLSRHLAGALRRSVRALARRHSRAREVGRLASVVKAFSLTVDPQGSVKFMVDVEAARGVADSGDPVEDLPELFREASDVAASLAIPGIALFLDEIQEATIRDLAALSMACHEMGRVGGRVLVVAAGLPYVPTRMAAAKSYAERLYHYVAIDRLPADAARLAITAPASRLGVEFTRAALDSILDLSEGYPYFIQAFSQGAWDEAPGSPIGLADVEAGRLLAQEELNSGFFGPRVQRATPRQREYMVAMATLGRDVVQASSVAESLNVPVSTLSPVRDALIKKGLIYSPERGCLAFTVPHFSHYLRAGSD